MHKCYLMEKAMATHICIYGNPSPINYTVRGILQARIQERVAFPFSRGIFPTQGLNPGLLHCFLIHSSADGHLRCFHVLAIVNSATMNIGVHVSFSVSVSSGYMPSSGIAGLYGGFIPSFLRNLHTILHSG